MPKKKRVLVSVKNELFSDQRVKKTCNTLVNNNYEVIVFSLFSKVSDENFRNIVIKTHCKSGFFFFAEFNIKLFFLLLKHANSNDILVANDVDALIPNYLVKFFKSNFLIFDSHEIYSELPSITNNFIKSFWKFLEKFLIPKVDAFYTVSESCAQWFYNQYNRKPEVILNVPYLQKKVTHFFPENLPNKFIIYQGDVSKNRGIELMIDAMQYIDNHYFVIVGDGLFCNELQQYAQQKSYKEKIIFFGKIPSEKLHLLTQKAEIGISLENDSSISYQSAFPNKFFDYIHAEIPCVVAQLAEYQRFFKEFSVGKIIDNYTAISVAEAINEVLKMGNDFYKVELQRAKNQYNWENQEQKLLAMFP